MKNLTLGTGPKCIHGCPRGGFGHAGLDYDLPGPQKPPETVETKETHTQNEAKTVFFDPLLALFLEPFKGPFWALDTVLEAVGRDTGDGEKNRA